MGQKFSTEFAHGSNAIKKLAAASTKIAKAVGATLGPHGALAALGRVAGAPTMTKDGVTVLYDLSFKDKVESMVYELYRDVGDHVSKVVGDGTTSVVLIMDALLQQVVHYAAAGYEVRELIQGMREACADLIERLAAKALAGDTEEALEAVLRVSTANEEEIVRTLRDVFMEVGEDGMIFVRDSESHNTKVYYDEGYVITAGPKTSELFEDGKMSVLNWKKPYVMVVNESVLSSRDLVPILEDIQLNGDTKEVVIVYKEMSNDCFELIRLTNRNPEANLKIAAIRMPQFAERQCDYLEDFEAFVDAKASSLQGMFPTKNLQVRDLGTCEEVEITRYSCRFLGGRGTKKVLEDGKTRLQQRLEHVRTDRNFYTGNIHERQRANERLAKLMGSVVVISPGADSEADARRKKGVLEDAIMAAQAAISEGILPGGGYAMYVEALRMEAEDKQEDTSLNIGRRILFKAARCIFEKLCSDVGEIPELLHDRITGEYDTYNFQTRCVGDMLQTNVCDPVKLLRTVLDQATSAISTIASANGLIWRKPTKYHQSWKERVANEHMKY